MLLRAVDIRKTYGEGHAAIDVLDGLYLEYNAGEVVGIFGASGSGKSTLLHIIGGLDRPTSGSVLFRGEDIYLYREDRLAAFRNRTVGFVFQFYHLLPEFNALENVMLPCLIAGIPKSEARDRALSALEKTGLIGRRTHRPSELSGGEQQRVAISRAIVMSPEILLADEPTGNLDKRTGRGVMETLKELNARDKMGIIMVTHDISLIDDMDRKLELQDGKIR